MRRSGLDLLLVVQARKERRITGAAGCDKGIEGGQRAWFSIPGTVRPNPIANSFSADKRGVGPHKTLSEVVLDLPSDVKLKRPRPQPYSFRHTLPTGRQQKRTRNSISLEPARAARAS